MALVAIRSNRFTLAPILARAWVAGDVKVGTVFPCPTVVTRALVASISVHTFSVLARVGLSIELIALVHVDVAIGSNVSLSTSAPVGIGSIWQ